MTFLRSLHSLPILLALAALPACGTPAPSPAERSDSQTQGLGLPPPASACPPWHVRTLLENQGTLENLLLDDHGGIFLSDNGSGRLLRFAIADGTVSVVADGLPSIGGLAMQAGDVVACTGDGPLSGLFGLSDGTIVRIDPMTGDKATRARGLVMPNGLALLPDGSAVTTRDIEGLGATGLTRIAPDGTVDPWWSDLQGCNGAGLDPAKQWLYVSRTFAPRAEIWRVRVDNPLDRRKVADLGVGVALTLDDLAVSAHGALYVAGDLAGSVFQVDLTTGTSCTIATGMPMVSSVKIADDGGGSTEKLYATSLNGALYELTAP